MFIFIVCYAACFYTKLSQWRWNLTITTWRDLATSENDSDLSACVLNMRSCELDRDFSPVYITTKQKTVIKLSRETHTHTHTST